MTTWAFAFGWNWLLVPVAAWFLRGVWVSTQRPWLRLISVSRAGDEVLLTVERQQRLPPWLSVNEVWLLVGRKRNEAYKYLEEWHPSVAFREGDGKMADSDLLAALQGIHLVALAREKELEELSK